MVALLAEEQALREWDSSHIAERHGGVEPDMGSLGGRLTFTITRLVDRDMVGVECNRCRVSGADMLDYAYCLNDRSKG